MANNYTFFRNGVNLVPAASSVSAKGDIAYNSATDKIEIYDGGVKSLVSETGTQTLTNKTLSGNTATNLISGSGTLTLNTTGTITVPNATDTLVGKATTDTLTNKSISGSTNTLSNIANASLTNSTITIGSTSTSLGGTSATIAGLTLTTPTINGAALSGTFSGAHTYSGAVTLSSVVGIISAPGTTNDQFVISGTTTVSGTTQRAMNADMTGTSNGTVQLTGYRAKLTSGAAVTDIVDFQGNAPAATGGAITRFTSYLEAGAAAHIATNNASFADNISYTGNFFLNQSGSDASVLGGALTINSTSDNLNTVTGGSVTLLGGIGVKKSISLQGKVFAGNATNDRRMELSHNSTNGILNNTYGSAGGSNMLLQISDVTAVTVDTSLDTTIAKNLIAGGSSVGDTSFKIKTANGGNPTLSVQFLNSTVVAARPNWLFGTNQNNNGVLEVVPSTADGGSTWSGTSAIQFAVNGSTGSYTGSVNIPGGMSASGTSTFATLNATGVITSTASGTGLVTSASTTGNQAISVTNTAAGTGNAARLKLINDVPRSLSLYYTSSTYSGTLITSGTSGEGANIFTDGAFGLSIGTNSKSALNIDSNQNVISIAGTMTQGYDTSTATSGTITASANKPGLIINSAGGTTLIIKLPSSPVDGQHYFVGSVGTFTTITWQDSGGTAGNVIGGQAAIGGTTRGQEFVYSTALTKWISVS